MVHDPGNTSSGLPDDWQVQVFRAYETFGADEFVSVGNLLRGARDYWTPEKLAEKAKKQLRDPKTKQWIKSRGFLPGGKEKREARARIGDDSTDLVDSMPKVKGFELLPQAWEQLTPEAVAARQKNYEAGLSRVPPMVDKPVLQEHIIQDVDEAAAILKRAGMPAPQAHEIVGSGMIVTRDGKNFAWVPFDLQQQKADQEALRKKNEVLAQLFQDKEDNGRLLETALKQLQEHVAEDWENNGDPRWANLQEAIDLDRDGYWNDEMDDGRRVEDIVDAHMEALKAWAEENPDVYPHIGARILQRDNLDKQYKAVRKEAMDLRNSSSRPLSKSMTKNPDGTIGLDEERTEWIKNVLDAAETVHGNLPQKLEEMPDDVRRKYSLIEVLSHQETLDLYSDQRGAALEKSLGWTSIGSNRMVINVGNNIKKLEENNALIESGDPESLHEALAWSMPARAGADGIADLRKALAYVVAHESGHQLDQSSKFLDPRYAMSPELEKVMEALNAGGLGQYAMTISENRGWQAWEAVAEALAHYFLHDQYQPADQRIPAVQALIELFGLELPPPPKPPRKKPSYDDLV